MAKNYFLRVVSSFLALVLAVGLVQGAAQSASAIDYDLILEGDAAFTRVVRNVKLQMSISPVAEVSWEIENDTGSATIDENGVIIGTTCGLITVIAKDANGAELASEEFTVADSGDNLMDGRHGDFEGYIDDATWSWLDKPLAENATPATYYYETLETVEKGENATNTALTINVDPTKDPAAKASVILGKTHINKVTNKICVEPLSGKGLYEMSFWVKTENMGEKNGDSGRSFIYIVPKVGFYQGNDYSSLKNATWGADTVINLPMHVNSEWQKITLPIQIATPDQRKYYISPHIIIMNNTNAKLTEKSKIYIDDVEIRRVGFDEVRVDVSDFAEGTATMNVNPYATTGTPISITDTAENGTIEKTVSMTGEGDVTVSALTNKNLKNYSAMSGIDFLTNQGLLTGQATVTLGEDESEAVAVTATATIDGVTKTRTVTLREKAADPIAPNFGTKYAFLRETFENGKKSYKLAIVAGIDGSESYESVGFEYKIGQGDTVKVENITNVYESLAFTYNGGRHSVSASDLGAKYLFYTEIDLDDVETADEKITFNPFAVTAEETINGAAVTVNVVTTTN